jgi:Ca2+/H+ antiporter, TMEM165/GDT1 family
VYDAHYHPVERLDGAVDDVEVAVGRRVEAAWAEGGGQLRSLPRLRASSPLSHCAVPDRSNDDFHGNHCLDLAAAAIWTGFRCHPPFQKDAPTGFNSMDAFLLSFGVIFLAELGDKSQLMAMAFATRYKATSVLIGITLATAVVHALSVVIGWAAAVNLPVDVINMAAGLAFLAFAAWTIRGDSLTPEERARASRAARSPIVAVGVAFFLAELGDKTMLATVTLATTEEMFGTWIGSTLGMVVADAIAIVIGKQLGARLPERAIKIGAAVLFVAFGVLLILEGVRG